ncbi:Nidogen-2 [Mactra antiquata]
MLKLAALAVFIAGAHALYVCPHNVCDTVDCAAVDNCNGRVSQGGGWCGCCDVCMTQLGEGELCMSTFLLGVPSTSECGQGLHCDSTTMKCVADSADTALDTPCLRRKAEIQKSKENGLPLIGVSDPQCDSDGNYMVAQCEGSVCSCVDTDGNPIDSYQSPIGELANMGCQCARDLAAYMKSGLIGKLFYCDSNGNYRTTTSAPAVMMTDKPTAAMTDAPTGSLTGTNTVTGACAQELLTAQSSNLLGTFVPECDADGMYTPRQCQGSECYCVRKDGTKIEGYSSPISMKDRVTCQCARDKDMFENNTLLGNIHTCRANGNYQQYQCIGSVCYCTDDNGDKLMDQSVNIGSINDLKCM